MIISIRPLNVALIKVFGAILLFLTIAIGAQAKEHNVYLTRFWQTSEGVPSNVVYDTAKDRDGFLWIATSLGIARFDGLRFQLFGPEDGLPDTLTNCLHVDKKGRIWVGTRHGVAYRENGRWIIPADFPNEIIYALGEGTDGSIWAGGYYGCLRVTQNQVTRIRFGTITPDVRSFLSEGDAGMLILARDNLYRWKADKPTEVEEIAGPWEGKDLRDITRDREGRVILCGAGILIRRRENEWEDLNPLLPMGDQNANLACTVAADNTLWLATRNHGLIYLKGNENGAVDSANGLSLDDVRSVMIDSDGMIWAGTNGGGINRLRKRPFDIYSTAEGLGRTVTSALVIDNQGDVFAGTDGGGVFRKNDGRFEPAFQNIGLPDSGLIWSLCSHSDGSLWIGTYQDGLFHISNDHADHFPVDTGVANSAISALYETRDGGLLVGMHVGGVRKWKDGRFDPSIHGPFFGDEHRVHDLLEDRQGRIWVAAGGSGLWRFASGEWKEVAGELGMPGMCPTAFRESPNGDLWIGTLEQGLIRYRGNQIVKWGRKDGLVSDTIFQILEDDNGHLWLGTDRGLQRVSSAVLDAYQPDKHGLPLTSMRFSREDGLPTPQFSGQHGNLAARAKDGSLWFSLASGVIRVDPRQISESLVPPYIRIESAAVDKGSIWNFESPESSEQIVVEPGAGTLHIRFTSPNFNTPERGRYRYRMAALENEWQEVEGTRLASYASMPPGHYQFEVTAATSDGTWNPTPTRISVVIKPFIWQTLGFRLTVLLVTLTLMGLLIRTWSVRRLHRRLELVEQERRVDKERARIARDLHDDLGASLTEINFLGTLTANLVTDLKIRSRVEGMVDRSQRMAKSLDEIVWTINPANDTLSSTANYLCSRAQESLATADIRCRLNIADHLPTFTVDSELRHHLLMAVNEAIHNVMKHSGADECILSIHIDQGELLVSVADNGNGFVPENEPGYRNGLLNLQRRMEASAGSVTIESSDSGTIVTLRIPLPGKKSSHAISPISPHTGGINPQ